MTFWAVYTTATGALLSVVCCDTHPRFNGFAWDGATMSATSIGAAVPDPATYSWSTSGKAFVEDAAKVEAILIKQVKADNETRVRGIYSTNYGKQKKYARKQQEVLDYRALGGTLNSVLTAVLDSATFTVPLATMTVTQQRKKFRFAMAQATKRSVSLATIIAEFEAAIDTVENQVAAWEAVELEAIRSIKSAQTAALKRAAYAAINWNWTP